MALLFTKSWREYQPGDEATPSGPHVPAESHLVEELQVAEYHTTEGQTGDSPEPTSKSDPEVRENLSAKALRGRLDGLPYRDSGAGLYGLATDVAERVGPNPDNRDGATLRDFCLHYPEVTREVLEGSE